MSGTSHSHSHGHGHAFPTHIDGSVFDITILGGGPTGLFAAFYAGLRNASCKIIDSMPALGGRLTAVYPEKHIYDVAGFPKVLARDLVDSLVTQAMAYSPTVCLGEAIDELRYDPEQKIYALTTDKGIHFTRTLIVAAGVGAYTPKRHPAETAARYEGHGLDYAVLRKDDYAGREVLVLGGGDSALDWANELQGIASSVTLAHRTEKFRAHEDNVHKLQRSGARILLNTEATEFHGVVARDGQRRLTGVTLASNGEEASSELLHCDAALVMFGFNSSLGKIKTWGLEMNEHGIRVNERMETNLPGVFAAGDVADYGAKLKLIATGFSEAAIAVAFAKTHMNPKEKAQPLHSTTIMELKEKKAKRGL